MAILRDKTVKKLSGQLCKLLEEVLDQISRKTYNEMREIVWEFTYDPQTAAQEFGFQNDISEKDCETIRAELANQYRSWHPDWDYGKERAEEDETWALWKALGGDQYAYHTVIDTLKGGAMYYGKESVLKIQRCLSSKREESKFGGLRELGFSKEESQFLMSAVDQMAPVFETLMAKSGRNFYSEGEDVVQTLHETNVQEKTNENPTSDTCIEVEKKSVNLSELLERREEIESFYKLYDEVMNNPHREWLIASREDIESLFRLCEKLNG